MFVKRRNMSSSHIPAYFNPELIGMFSQAKQIEINKDEIKKEDENVESDETTFVSSSSDDSDEIDKTLLKSLNKEELIALVMQQKQSKKKLKKILQKKKIEIDMDRDITPRKVESPKPMDEIVIRSGLINLGNTCFMNSAMQCLAISPFIIKFLSVNNEDDIVMLDIIKKYDIGDLNITNIKKRIQEMFKLDLEIPKKDKQYLIKIFNNTEDIYIYLTFKRIMFELNESTHKVISCHTFIQICKDITRNKFYAMLFNGSQNDPHEFMAYILDRIHNAKSKKYIFKDIDQSKLSELEKTFYSHFKTRYQNDFSYFVKNFYYYMLNCTKCSKCNNISNEFSPNDMLCLPLPKDYMRSFNIHLYQCFDEMFNASLIPGYKCDKCHNNEENLIEKKIYSNPESLIIKLIRYNNTVKCTKMINYPEILDISKYCIDKSVKHFKLYGIINHIGSLNGGHYFAYINKDDNWFNCNDSIVTQISKDKALSSEEAYILFYHSV